MAMMTNLIPSWANVDLINQQFANQIQTELYLIEDILNQTKQSYHINKDQFSNIGSADINHPNAISQIIPNHFCLANLYAFVNQNQQVAVHVVFKSQADNVSCSNLMAGTTLVFLSLSNSNQIIDINQIDDHENDITSFQCIRPTNPQGQTFGMLKSFDSTESAIDLTITLPPPINQCQLVEE
ncbi:MAG: hypothetical protein CMF46_00315 [Legionellales bacterium]|nr:hypothetical protein [Legionellales bacterium]